MVAGEAPRAFGSGAKAVQPTEQQGAPWSAQQSVVLVTVEPTRRQPSFTQLVQLMSLRFGIGVVLAADRPATVLRDWLASAGHPADLRFIDLVAAPGRPVSNDGKTLHLESATQLELAILRAEQWLQRMPGKPYLIVDSVSALAMVNGTAPVVEAMEHLADRLRRLGVPTAFVLVDRQSPTGLGEALRPSCDGVLRL